MRRTETNGYLSLEHEPGLKAAMQPAVLLPLGDSAGVLQLKLLVPRGAQGRIAMLPEPGMGRKARGLELEFRPDGTLRVRFGKQETVLEYPQDDWAELVLQGSAANGGYCSVQLKEFDDQLGILTGAKQAIFEFEGGPVQFKDLLLDASQPGAKMLVDAVFYGWGGKPAECPRLEKK